MTKGRTEQREHKTIKEGRGMKEKKQKQTGIKREREIYQEKNKGNITENIEQSLEKKRE